VNEYPAGSASIVELVDILDSTSTTGAGKTGLAYNTASLTCYYKRSNGTAAVAVTLVDITTLGTYVSGGFKEIDSTHMPGAYEFHPPNAAFNSGAKYVTFYFVGAAGMVRRPIKYRILGGLDPDNATNLGIPALVADPMAAVPASYLSTQIGGMVGAIKTQSDKLQFDGSNNVKALVNLYASGQDPGAIVWGAATSYNTIGTMGGLQNNPIVAGYATGQAPDYLTWNAALATYNTATTFGAKVNTLANASDPWTATVGTGYTSLQAGYFLNAIKGQSDKLTFDGSNNIRSHVYTYESAMSPEALVWGALAVTYNGTGTMGGLLNAAAPGGGGYSDPWATVLGSGGYTSGQAGYLINAMSNTVDNFQFDISNNVMSKVNAYSTGLDPASSTWDALLSDHATSDTFGAMLNAPIVAGYAAGQSPAESVLGATLASYSLSGSVGAKLNAIGGDPWLTSVSSGYLSTQAGGVLNSIGGRVDGPVSGVPALLMASSVYSGTTYLQAIRAIANAAAGDVVRVGTTRQFNVYPIGDTGHLSAAMVATSPDDTYLQRTVNSLSL
jgi:hypothetical protein